MNAIPYKIKTINNKIKFLMLGGLYSMGLMLSETLVGYTTGNTLESKFYLLALPIYICTGIMIGAFAKTIKIVLNKLVNLLFKLELPYINDLIFIPVLIIFIQGLVIFNAVTLEGTNFLSDRQRSTQQRRYGVSENISKGLS